MGPPSGTSHKAEIDAAFIGRRCTDVVRFATESWRFEFEGQTTLDVRCPWRIVKKGRIALGNSDDGQQFGLPSPVDAKREALALLGDRVVRVTIRENTADLIVELADATYLEAFNSSSGYEGWECSSKTGLLVVAQGGGQFQIWITDPPLR
jgi:hypothetical protein